MKKATSRLQRETAQREAKKGKAIEEECDRLAANPYDLHKVGVGVKWSALDAPRAIEACQKAVQLFPDSPRLQYQYGRALSKWKQYKNSVKWYRLSAEQGYAAGQNALGNRYANGKGIPKDATNALKWRRLAANQGYAPAQYNVGRQHFNGAEVSQDHAKAAKWFRLAADQGYIRAQTDLGFLYVKGKGVPKDFSKAAKWFRLAADQGNADSQYNLGVLYEEGGASLKIMPRQLNGSALPPVKAMPKRRRV